MDLYGKTETETDIIGYILEYALELKSNKDKASAKDVSSFVMSEEDAFK